MSAPTSTLTFGDLVIEAALFLGIAYYGANGDEAPVAPTDAHDLALCRRHANNAVRKFLLDGPPSGWRWARPVMSFTVFGPVSAVTGQTVSGGVYDVVELETPLTANAAVFYPGMEYRTISIADAGDFEIIRYVSATEVVVRGDASSVSGKTFAVDTKGDYTLPASFGGDYTGDITYTKGTNQSVSLEWVHESKIRQWRENVDDESGDPYWAAVRPMAGAEARLAKRWELVMYPEPDEVDTVEFPYQLSFDATTSNNDPLPMPFTHDETVRSAVLAMAERDTDDMMSAHHQAVYEQNLRKSYEIDARSAPARLGYNGNGPHGRPSITEFRDRLYNRPIVNYNTD